MDSFVRLHYFILTVCMYKMSVYFKYLVLGICVYLHIVFTYIIYYYYYYFALPFRNVSSLLKTATQTSNILSVTKTKILQRVVKMDDYQCQGDTIVEVMHQVKRAWGAGRTADQRCRYLVEDLVNVSHLVIPATAVCLRLAPSVAAVVVEVWVVQFYTHPTITLHPQVSVDTVGPLLSMRPFLHTILLRVNSSIISI